MATETNRGSAHESSRRWHWLGEAQGVMLLALAGMGTSWSTYQAGAWSGVQSEHYARAVVLTTTSSERSLEAGQQQTFDIAIFLNWAAAYARGDSELTDFLRERARPEFRPALDAWDATKPLLNPAAAPTPFSLPEYRLQKRQEAALPRL